MNVVRNVAEVEPEPLLLTVEDYRILADAGAFDERPKVELIEGVILTVNSERRWHTRVKSELGLRLSLAVRELRLPLVAEVEGTVALSEHSAPDPDITLAGDSSLENYIPVSAVAVIVEVADSNVRYALNGKRRLYAKYSVPEYWVVARKQVHRFWSPSEGDYRQKSKTAFGEPIPSATIAGLIIASDGLT